jgi:hypothetical protein
VLSGWLDPPGKCLVRELNNTHFGNAAWRTLEEGGIRMYMHETRAWPIGHYPHPACGAGKRALIQTKQLRRLQVLWRRWSGSLGLLPESDRRLRHYYIQILTQGRASETRELRETDAAQVIQWLDEMVRGAEIPQRYAAGTAGRRGFPEQRHVQPGRAAWRALWSCAETLGMERPDLERFIRRHYAGVGLRGLADLRTMADLNRVLWGLKAIGRRRHAPRRFAQEEKWAA